MIGRQGRRGLERQRDAFAASRPGERGVERAEIARVALEIRMPVIFPLREFAAEGGLMSFGVSFPGQWRRAAEYVNRILKGAAPASLPIEQPTIFELVINLRTARALDIAIPPAILARADEVIE